MLLADKHEPEKMRKECDGTYDLKKMCGNGDFLIKVTDLTGKERQLLAERKTTADFVHTIYQEGRLNEQLKGIDVLVFEKFYVPKMGAEWWIRLHTYLNGVSAHTVVFYTLSSAHTIKQLRIAENKLRDGSWGTMRHSVQLPSVTSKENEEQVRVLLGFPGMGEKRCNEVLAHYGTLASALANASSWATDVEGIGPKTQRHAEETLKKQYVHTIQP